MLQNGIIRYRHTKAEAILTTQLIRCFQEVFAERPWNEWRKCATCGARWGTKDLPELETLNFTHCGIPVSEYWPAEEVRGDLDHEISPDASCWLAIKEGLVVGFCWGYEINVSELEQKLGIGLASGIASCFGDIHRIAYQDELGVVAQERGTKLAKRLYLQRHEDFLQQGLSLGVVRTRRSPEPSVTYLWFTEKLGYKTIAEYPEGDGRVVLAQTLEQVSAFSSTS